MRIDVPFYTQQWDDNEWSAHGFASKEELQYWQPRSGGVLCLKMAMDAARKFCNQASTPPIKEVIDMAVKYRGHKEGVGWWHWSLAEAAKAFGQSAKAGNFSRYHLKNALLGNLIPIVSVRPGFRGPRSFKERFFSSKKYGGQLAVIIGYFEKDDEITGFYVHHPSKDHGEDWEGVFISIKDFLRSYTGRGLVVGPGKTCI